MPPDPSPSDAAPAPSDPAPSDEDFRLLADSLPQLAWMADGGGHIFWYNQRWRDFTGLGDDDMLGWGWTRVHHPDHLEGVIARIREAFRTGETWEDTFPLRRHDGEYRWFLSRARPHRDATGRVVRWFGTNTDITDRREAGERLALGERRFRSLIESTAAIVWTTPASGEMLEPQPGWSAYTGQSFAELRGWGWTGAVHPEDREALARDWAAAVEGGQTFASEHRLRRHDGEWRWMSVRATAVTDAHGRVTEWVGADTDITERRVAEAAARAALEQAEEANRAKSRFLANMSHELRTPLSAVIGYSEMLEEEVEELGEAHLLDDLRKINSNARHLLGLINDVLDISKIEAERMTVSAASFEPAATLHDVGAAAEALVHRKSNRLVLDVPEGLGTMRTDELKLRQCLLNLLGNAAKFTEDGTITLRARREEAPPEGTALEAARHGGWLLFDVLDTGIGMTAEQVERLFERFAQADESTTRQLRRHGARARAVARLRAAAGRGHHRRRAPPARAPASPCACPPSTTPPRTRRRRPPIPPPWSVPTACWWWTTTPRSASC